MGSSITIYINILYIIIYEQLRQLLAFKLAIFVIELELGHKLCELLKALLHAPAQRLQVIMQPK